MPEPFKYAIVERERRFLLAAIPDGVTSTSVVADRYLTGTRLRLREIRHEDGSVQRKLGQKVRLTDGPQAIAHTTIYLDDAEWELLTALPATTLTKTRHIVERDGWRLAIDEHVDGALVAEIDDGGERSLPDWLDVIADVTDLEAWTGARIAVGLGQARS